MSQDRVDNLFASESWTAVYTAFTNISLKAYDFDTIRESLLTYINQSYPDKFNDFIASSEFIAILDLVAYLGHSLSFRLDMNTRENFLDTAERRESVLRMARNLGYNKTRPINARGFMKITSISTNETVYDNTGNSLADISVNWNDANDPDWYENFIVVLNSAFNENSKIQDPVSEATISGVEHKIYEINESPSRTTVNYPFKTNLSGDTRRFEGVRAEIVDDVVLESEPNSSRRFTIVNRNDSLGAASDRTGFFVYAKAGTLKVKNFTYDIKLTNRVQTISDNNISNSDVWIQKVDPQGTYLSSVTKVDNETRETAIYNSLRTGSGDLVSVNTIIDNGIELRYPDGIFGNAAEGNYRVWYRVADNESYDVNRNDIKEQVINVPYIGADDREYTLSLTMSSTRDFSENYEAETFSSVRRIAPRSFYAQDRMVNGQDYNVLPLSLGQNVVRKVKAVNESFAGNSRYFEMDDVLGNHSNVNVTGVDGSLYVDKDDITMKLRFNRISGKTSDFIRNELVKAIKHPSLINAYYHLNQSNTTDQAVLELTTDQKISIEVDPTNRKVFEVHSTGDGGDNTNPHSIVMYPGDYIYVESDSTAEAMWTRIYGPTVRGSGLSNQAFITESVIPYANSDVTVDAKITKIVRGFRTRFEPEEIEEIKTKAIDDQTVDSFTIKYVPIEEGEETFSWQWKVHNEGFDDALDPTKDIYVDFKYNTASIRDIDTEYTATFTGRKVVFESNDEVKFFYSNENKIVDIETNLSSRDTLTLDYYNPGEITAGGSEYCEPTTNDSSDTHLNKDNMTIGISDILSYNQVGNAATFTAQFKEETGAPKTLGFIQDCGMIQDSTTYTLVSPIGLKYEVTPDRTYSTPIGNSANNEYTIHFDEADISLYQGGGADPVDNETVEATNEYAYSSDVITVTVETGNVANADSSFISLSSTELADDGFKGSPSTTYFNEALNNNPNNFFFIKKADMPSGVTLDTIQAGDTGTIENFTVFSTSTSNTYGFQFAPADLPSGQQLVYWKQIAFAECNFTSTRAITKDTLVIKSGTTIYSNDHVELEDLGNNSYKLIFWTIDPGVGSTIDIFDTSTGDGTIQNFKLRVDASVRVKKSATQILPRYSQLKTYVYDKFLTPAGYVDYSKVKLSTVDFYNNPFGTIQSVEGRQLVLETYTKDNIEYERISKRAIVTQDPANETVDFAIFYDPSDFKWKNRESIEIAVTPLPGHNPSGTQPHQIVEVDNGHYGVIEGGERFKVVDGMTYLNQSLVKYKWNHFADADRRIDPSTSNIVDVYALTGDYVRRINQWIAGGFGSVIPKAPNNYELKKIMEPLNGKNAIADHVSYIPVKFKMLFGEYADAENQAVFKVLKKKGTTYTDSEVKTAVSSKVNEYFNIDNWEFGDTFYFSELAAYLHKELPDYISSVVVTPKFNSTSFTKILSISSELNEIFLSVTTSKDVKIISSITDAELLGE